MKKKMFKPCFLTNCKKQSAIASFRYIKIYLQHHSIRPSPSQVFAQWLSARFFIATAYSHRVSSSSQCSRQILSKSPTKQNNNKKPARQIQRVSLSPWQDPYLAIKRSYIMHTEITLPGCNEKQGHLSLLKHKIPGFGPGRGYQVLEKPAIF